jgi:hypothetical protein
METNELRNRLVDLQKKEKTFSELLSNFSFKTEIEANNYIEQNKSKFDELKEIRLEIKEIEWKLMSDYERQEYIEYQKKIKEKYSDD